MIEALKNKSILKNAGWLASNHILNFIGGFFISVWLARYLGPEKMGIYGYALALYAIASSVATLGLTSIAVRELVAPEKEIRSVFSTIFLIKSIGGGLMFILLIAFITLNGLEGDKYYLSLIIGGSLLISQFSTLNNFFDSILSSKYNVISKNISFIIKSLLIVLFITLEWPFYILAVITAAEVVLSTSYILFAYLKRGVGFQFILDVQYAKSILRKSWPLIISSLGAILYLKMDQVMVVDLVGNSEGGIYNVAVKYSSIFYFIQTIVMTSVFPSLIKTRKTEYKKYLNNTEKLSSFFLYTAGMIIVLSLLFADKFVELTFGEKYMDAVPIIKLHILSLPLIYWGAILSRWLVIEDLTKYSLARHAMGLAVNLILNLILIPKYGGEGAAIASIFALLFSVIVVLVFHPRLFILLKVFLRSITLPLRHIERLLPKKT